MLYGVKALPEYWVWKTMRRRCRNPGFASYSRYGAVGVTMCEAWFSSFKTFYADMGPRPSDSHSIERMNGTKGYEPGNCVWATSEQQARNRKSNRWLTIGSETLCMADWCARYKIKPATVYLRVKKGMSMLDAVTIPVLSPVERPKGFFAKYGTKVLLKPMPA